MSLKLNTKYLEGFVSEHEYEGMAAQVTAAHNTLVNRNGLGNDFLGWVTLPEDYDKEEFARIKAARIKEKVRCSHRYRYRRILSWCKSCNRAAQVAILQQS